MSTKATRRGRPRKSSEDVKCKSILLRVEEREKQAFADAAKVAGAPLAVWMRERLRLAARRELEGVGRLVPFLPTVDDFLEGIADERPKKHRNRA